MKSGVRMTKRDFKKERKDLYSPKPGIFEVSVPSMRFIAVDGEGPLDGERIQGRMQTLFNLAYGIKMCRMHGIQPEGCFEYTVMPPEGLYGTREAPFDPEDETTWTWKMIIRQPEFVDEELFESVREAAKRRKPELNLDSAYLLDIEEGFSVQILHTGSYSSTTESVRGMQEHILEQGYRVNGPYHEIYLSDPNRVEEEKLKTILRLPVVPGPP
ncbi:MAG: GyrI-like domain-containing protein [Gudongella sp.]|nr:GyrI-like domain-containing protein [Gudongella sp.]